MILGGAIQRPLIRPERYGLFYRLVFAVFVIGVPTILASNWSVFRDGDVSWHVATGRWILEHGQIPRTDPFSFAMAGHPWVAHEWLAEIIYGAAFDTASYAGLSAVVALALMALFAIVFVHLRPMVRPAGVLVAVAALGLGLLPFILARPHLLAWPFLAGWTAVLLSRRGTGRAPPLWLALAMFGWANLHASFIIGFVIAGAVALDEWIAEGFRWSTVRRWLPFGLASLAAALLNLNGLAGFLHPLNISGMESLPDIGEWKATTQDRTPTFYPILLIGLAIVLVRRPRFSPGELILLIGSLALALLHLRHQSLFLILAVLIIPLRLSTGPVETPMFDSPREGRLAAIGAVVVALIVALVISQSPIMPKEREAYPSGLIAHVPPQVRDRPVFNNYTMGGPLILAGIRPYIDGRADMYGDAHVQEYLKTLDGKPDQWAAIVRRYDIGWTMLGNGDKQLIDLLDSLPGWQRVYSDGVGVIHVRRDVAGEPQAGQGRAAQAGSGRSRHIPPKS